MDYNKIYTVGDLEKNIINCVVEIPQGSNQKIEWNRETGAFELDRIEPAIFAKPTNYGFIPKTLDDDGDELDVLLITDTPIYATGLVVPARILGVLEFEDDGEIDDKIIAVPADDRNNKDAIQSLGDLPQQVLDQIKYHFDHYKDLKKPGTTKVKGLGDAVRAVEIINECIERYNAKQS